MKSAVLTINERYVMPDGERIFDMSISTSADVAFPLSFGESALTVAVANTSSQAISKKCSVEREAWERGINLEVVINTLTTPPVAS